MLCGIWLSIDVVTVESGSHSVTDREQKQLGAFHPDVAIVLFLEVPAGLRGSFWLKPFVLHSPCQVLCGAIAAARLWWRALLGRGRWPSEWALVLTWLVPALALRAPGLSYGARRRNIMEGTSQGGFQHIS